MNDRSYIVAVDVAYDADRATIACIAFDAWTAESTTFEQVTTLEPVAPYVPGKFYQRELPCILHALAQVPEAPTHVVVDGFVWLDAEGRLGLGGHLWQRLDEAVVVVGVAKSALSPLPPCAEVRRGASDNPLYVSAAGMAVADAAALVSRMHGAYRVPSLLRRVDQLSRGLG